MHVVSVRLAGSIRGRPSHIIGRSGNCMLEATKMDLAHDGIAINSKLSLRQCRHGPMMYLRSDTYIGRSFDQYGEYSEGEVALFRDWLRPGDVALDVGANIGALTIPMARLVGPTGTVYSFEPQRIVFQILCGNVAMNELGNVQTLQWAVGHAAGTTKVAPLDYGAQYNFGGISLGGLKGEDVAVIAIDDINLPKLRLLKMDVEGMELNAIMGATATIERCRPILFIENDRVEKSTALLTQLFNSGYRLWWHKTPLYNSANFLRNPRNVFGNIHSFNVLGLPSEMSDVQLPLREITSAQEATDYLAGLFRDGNAN
jgi:FkbM family methyltransferase